ncbi:LacI family DNA-binding transcriptional regulator [uncultured Neglectibacter sp.]|uniref:LacI family DNA-binding transcriptional regulator n=1 Tax=uncultured Neglectibacter sp. TaxID=1924108 RepID=UPI0034DE56D9
MNKPATMVQIAKECGVSIATVSRVLNGTAPVSQRTRERVEAAIHKHHYTPNAFARGLIKRQSMTLGIVMPDITNPYFSAMFRAFEQAARAAGYSVFLCNTSFFSSADKDGSHPPEAAYFKMLLDRQVDGVLVAGGQADLLHVPPEYRNALQELASAVPTVVLGNPIRGIDCLFLQRETGKGVFASMDHLASLGHRRIAFLGGERGVSITESRLGAYADALSALGFPYDKELVSLSDYYAPDGYSAMKSLLEQKIPFTAALAINDSVAFGAYRALADFGRRVPEDVSIVSCDQFFSADYFVPRLTGMDQHNEQFGRFVIQALLHRIQGIETDARIQSTPDLVLRESCAPPKAY